MYELRQTGPSSWYMDCPVRVGFLAAGDGVLMIDGGSDGDAGKKALACLEQLDRPLRAVLCTHSHGEQRGEDQHAGAPSDSDSAAGRLSRPCSASRAPTSATWGWNCRPASSRRMRAASCGVRPRR